MTVLGTYELATMDPTEAYFNETVSILSGLVTRSLTQYVYDPSSGSMVLVPDIATDIGTSNADFTEWSFTIRHGVKFEDGSEVTAEDVAYGIKRSFDRKAFPGGATYSNDYFVDGDSYTGPYRSGTSYAGIDVDGQTLTLKMARPFPDMPYWGAFPAMGPIPERRSDPASYGRHPLATGPYKFADYTPGESLTLVRNEHWDPDTDPGRHAYPDRYEFNFTVPYKQVGSTILGDSEAGETTLSYENVLPGDYSSARKLDRLTLGSGPCTHMWFMDYRRITDIRVRQAIGYAYPYEAALRAFGDTPGVTALPGTSILPPGFPGRQDYNPLETEPSLTDPKRAKALLQEAGFAPGEYELKWAYLNSDPFEVALTKQRVQGLEAGGFKASPVGYATYEQLAAVAATGMRR